MFLFRAMFWLTTLVLILPPAADGGPPPRVSVLHAAYAARILLQDMSGICDRQPEACVTSREALALLGRKMATGADIVAAGIEAGRAREPGEPAPAGTLKPEDMEPAWRGTTGPG